MKISQYLKNCYKTFKSTPLKKVLHIEIENASPSPLIGSSKFDWSISLWKYKHSTATVWWKISNSIELHNVMLQSAKIPSRVVGAFYLNLSSLQLHSRK